MQQGPERFGNPPIEQFGDLVGVEVTDELHRVERVFRNAIPTTGLFLGTRTRALPGLENRGAAGIPR